VSNVKFVSLEELPKTTWVLVENLPKGYLPREAAYFYGYFNEIVDALERVARRIADRAGSLAIECPSKKKDECLRDIITYYRDYIERFARQAGAILGQAKARLPPYFDIYEIAFPSSTHDGWYAVGFALYGKTMVGMMPYIWGPGNVGGTVLRAWVGLRPVWLDERTVRLEPFVYVQRLTFREAYPEKCIQYKLVPDVPRSEFLRPGDQWYQEFRCDLNEEPQIPPKGKVMSMPPPKVYFSKRPGGKK
jgi:hypothetical protein